MPDSLPVKYQTAHGEVVLSKEDIRKYICKDATDQEIHMFLQLCQYQRLNPFLKEAYLIKYGGHPATMVVGWHVFLRRAEANADFDGYEVEVYDQEGIPFIGLPNQEIQYAEAKVYRKSRKFPVVVRVLFHEYSTGRSQWAPDKMPATMIRKVALEQALREAFTTDLQNMYGFEEMERSANLSDIPSQSITQAPQPPIVPAQIADPIDEPPEDDDTPEPDLPNQEPPKPRTTPFAVIKYMGDLYGPAWMRTVIEIPEGKRSPTELYFGKTLKNAKEMEEFAATMPDAWEEGVKRLIEARDKKRAGR